MKQNKKKEQRVSIVDLREALNYDAKTGIFIWAKQRRGRGKKDHVAGRLHHAGYVTVAFNNCQFLAHRLAWFYVYEKWPANTLDHINMDRSDNRICNLREATMLQNLWNTASHKNNTSGFKGVYWAPAVKRWRVRIRVSGKHVDLGYFENLAVAAETYKRAAQKHRGEFARWE